MRDTIMIDQRRLRVVIGVMIDFDGVFWRGQFVCLLKP